MTKSLDIDAKECKACGACEEICPEIFKVSEDLGRALILDLQEYPEDKIEEAIIACPGRCIQWHAVFECFCQKYQESIKTTTPACPHPKDYCQLRSSCPLHFLEKHGAP